MASNQTIFAVGFVLAFALAVPTAAVTMNTDSATDDVTLEPSDTPNGQYTSIDAETIELDLEALNNRAITRADDVFSITVTDDDIEGIWIDHDVPGLTFYRSDQPTATINESSPLEPSAGTVASIGVAVDTHIAQSGTETFTVTVKYADEDNESDQSAGGSSGVGPSESSTIEPSSLNVSPNSLETGETTTVNATYRNLGETETVTPRLTVDGTVVDQQSITLEPGETETVSFERQMDWPGTYDVGIAGVGTESVAVEGPPINVVDATIDDAELTAGESTAIRATVRNPTDTAVDRTLEVAIDGIVVDSRAVTIPANGERTVVFERQFDEAGTYEIDVSGVDAGTVTVDERPTPSIRNRELSAATTAAIAPPATAGLLFLAMAANRRWAFVR